MEFFQEHLPFAEMRPADELTPRKDDYCLAKPGEVYAVYLPDGGSTELKLLDGKYTVQWFNPRSGGRLLDGTVRDLDGPGSRSLGDPPAERAKDWVVLVEAVDE